MLKTLFLVRHGLSSWNLEGRLRGRSNVGLSPGGFEQARGLSNLLEDTSISGIYSSPLKRALQTARIISKPHHLHVRILEELTGADVGDWEGKPVSQVLGEHKRLYKLGRYDDGEKFSAVMKRMGSAIDLIKKHSNSCALLVSHGDPIAATLCQVFNLGHQKMPCFYPDPASVSALSYQTDRPRLTLFNYLPNVRGLFLAEEAKLSKTKTSNE